MEAVVDARPRGPYRGADSLHVEVRADGVVIATLNRPDRLNSFDGTMRYAIRDLIREVRDDDDTRVLVMTGEGRAFCSGADLGAEDSRPWPTGANEPQFGWCVDLVELGKPTIAAINGTAAGGGLGLALLCDIRFCSEQARLIPLWTKRAIHPDDLVTWTLPRLVGYGRALEWLYVGDDIPMALAESTGLVQHVTPHDEVLTHALELATRLAAGPTTHYALTKQAVIRGLTKEPWDASLMEGWGQYRANGTEDAREGRLAFREGRPPQFTGR